MSSQRPFMRWGILGTGNISALFAQDLMISNENGGGTVHHVLKAVSTSDLQKGERFVNSVLREPNMTRVYLGSDKLFADEEVDIVYIGLPHSLHKDACISAARAGKHILCEKPLGINAKEVDEIIAAAKEHNVLTVEGVWTRFLPVVEKMQSLIHEEKIIGRVLRMSCDFSSNLDSTLISPKSRFNDPALGAGALLDLGIYPLTYSNLILDHEVGHRARTPNVVAQMVVKDGVDWSDVMIVQYDSPTSLGILSVSFEVDTQHTFCRIEGEDGIMLLSGTNPAKPEQIRVKFNDRREDQRWTFEHKGMGLYFEANAVAADVLGGRTESGVMPLTETRRVMGILDEVRRAGGVRYPQDN